jgi:integrase
MYDHHGTGVAPTTRRGRRATGQLYVHKAKAGDTSFAVRFRHGGKRHHRTLGYASGGWTKKKALDEIERLMSALWLGAWSPEEEQREPEEADADPLFADYAKDWFASKRVEGGADGRGLSESGEQDLAWCLVHLIRHFGKMRLSEIGVEQVDRFVYEKRTSPRGGDGPNAGEPLSPTSIRKFVRILRAVLARAVRHGKLPRNVADDVKVKARRYRGTSLDSADGIVALLDAAAEVDSERTRGAVHGRELLATLVFAGLRISEALGLRWRDVLLADGYLRVRGTKTEAASRTVDLLPPLREELADLKARRDTDPDALVFGTSTGGRANPSNVRSRLLMPAVERASAALVAQGKEPLPHITPHGLRRTFASLLVATGADPMHLSHQLGHTDAAFSVRTYCRVVQRRDGELERLRALVGGSELPGVPAEPEPAVAEEVA